MVPVRRGHFGSSSSRSIVLDDVQCTGREANISECRSAVAGERDCDHSEDAGVICGGLCVCVGWVGGGGGDTCVCVCVCVCV